MHPNEIIKEAEYIKARLRDEGMKMGDEIGRMEIRLEDMLDDLIRKAKMEIESNLDCQYEHRPS